MPYLNKKLATIEITFSGLFLFFCLLLTNAFAANYKPTVGTITPANGTSNPYQIVNFTTTYSDTNGWQNIKSADLLINNSPDGIRCFYAYYNRATNKLYLRNDANSTWLGGFPPSSVNIIENSYCKLDCSKSDITGSGKTLSINWAISFKTTFTGTKYTYLFVQDNTNTSSGWIRRGRWNITANSPPVTGTITPSSGSTAVNTPISFTTTYFDPNGWQDINYAYFLVNTSTNGANCFYGYYNRSINKLYLRNNANTIWLGGYSLGSSNIIENSYAKLDCSKTTVSDLSNITTVKWALTFKAASVGTKKTYLYVKDSANASSGWVQKGTWNIDASNKPPMITSILPEDNSTFLAGANINIKANASDPDNDPLQYQFSIGGSVKQTWSASDTYIWQTQASDTSAVSITCEVKDSNSNLTSKTISYSIINPTVEEILQKVADNYTKISDFNAGMTLSSTLDEKPFGATDYCRYYFKAPNKEKTETFNDASRTVKNDIIIISSTNMHLIDPIKNIKQTVDLLADAGINSTEFSQVDLYYNQPLFLSKNAVSKNDLDTDFNNMIIALDISPNEKNNIYDKLSILIDYEKGLISKFSIYRKNQTNILELVQETIAVDFQKMPNDAWLPVKMTKNPNLTSGKLISTLIYSNLKINQNLSDDIFDPNQQ